ncbi:sulfotransferase [Paractinoplanes hotanensis]|uniref:Sulfotransferase n=1 Tax=Paractinoplanes hotanensis TaxID=2906497 RepID=A0ABT0YBV7_9ACTN|nr:sulfotransferase [Actinoplanes hotanensis]MCM4083545.1 sulfotransferase [Actinoplanes hotanensis]
MLSGTLDGLTGSDLFADRLAALRVRRRPIVSGFTRRVQDVVLLVCSSRSGSSMLAEMLRRTSALLHLRAEFNPYLRLAGLAYPDSGTGSDQLDARHLAALTPGQRLVFEEELSLDVGRPDPAVDDEQFLLDAAWRFAVQWPAMRFDLADWLDTGRRVLAAVRTRQHDWNPAHPADVARFQTLLFEALAACGLPVRLAYYDLPHASRRPGPDDARGAPGDVLVEEPPFVLSLGWRYADERDLATRPLVIKTPSNAYRLGFLRALFPNARTWVLHLTRNPAASINGLYDGWLHHGFHAHRMERPLSIQSYGVDRPEDRWWWKFDLPPGWQEYTGATLPCVCALQWRSCHRAILEYVAGSGLPYLRVHFEDLMHSPQRRAAVLAGITGWLGVPMDEALREIARHGLREPVAATVPPGLGRWRRRAEMVQAAVGPQELELAEELGYADDDVWV